MPDPSEDLEEDPTALALLQQLLREVRESNAQIKAQMAAQNATFSSRIELLEVQNSALRAQLDVGGTAQTHSGRPSGSTLDTAVGGDAGTTRPEVRGASKRTGEPGEPTTPCKKPRLAEEAVNAMQTQRVETSITVPALLDVVKPEKTTPPSKRGVHTEAVTSSDPSSSPGKKVRDGDDDDIIIVKENPAKAKTRIGLSPHEQVHSVPKQSPGTKTELPSLPPTAITGRKRPKMVLEVCIRTDKSSRERLALAGSLEEVIRALQRSAEYSEGTTGKSGGKRVDYLDGKIVGTVANATSSQAKLIYRDLFEGDLTDLSDSDDKATSNAHKPSAEKALSSSSSNLKPPPTAALDHTAVPPLEASIVAKPKVKLKFNAKSVSPEVGRLLFDADSIRHRLTGFTDFPVDLSSDTRNALVTREFMTATYGGSPFEFFPKISADRRAALGGHAHHFLFPNLRHNPHAPQRPGQAGLLCRSGDEAPWGARAMTLLVRIRDGMWWYMGEYTTVRTAPLSPGEFARLARATKWAWASTVRKRKKRYDVEIRARVTLRRQLGREPTADELKCAFTVETKFDKVTEEEIIQAYEDGRERIYIWCFKCVGYDAKFQDELAEKFALFVPPAKLGKR